jgi:hypothetical protein
MHVLNQCAHDPEARRRYLELARATNSKSSDYVNDMTDNQIPADYTAMVTELYRVDEPQPVIGPRLAAVIAEHHLDPEEVVESIHAWRRERPYEWDQHQRIFIDE